MRNQFAYQLEKRLKTMIMLIVDEDMEKYGTIIYSW